MTKSVSVVVVVLLNGAAACSESSAPPAAPVAQPQPQLAPYAGERASVDEALRAYEEVRVALVNDKLDGIETAAKRMAESATKATAQATPAAKPHLEALAASASALASTTTQGIEPSRKAFGDVSKHVVGLLVDEPALKQGKFLFECPMAAGYKKWVQNDATISNPYMGQRMLMCGGKADWAV